jgi:type II secretory pathway pseudopilin PulG
MSHRDDPEAGTTLTEVLVVLVITTLLAVPLVAVVQTAARIQDDQQRQEAARIDLDRALAAMAEDLRVGSPVESRLGGRSATSTVGVQVSDDLVGAQIVYWSVTANGLQTFEVDPTTNRITSGSTLDPDVQAGTGATADEPAFRYFDANGRELDPLVVSATRLAECTALVEVALSVPIDDDPDTEVVSGSARHAVRSRSPGGNGC